MNVLELFTDSSVCYVNELYVSFSDVNSRCSYCYAIWSGNQSIITFSKPHFDSSNLLPLLPIIAVAVVVAQSSVSRMLLSNFFSQRRS